MKWLRLIVLFGVVGISLMPIIVLAGTGITVTVTPKVSGGITDFTVIYIDETEVDFTWGYSGNATKIMIRGKYTDYPANISDNATEPWDGYLVYYGGAVSANDTSMDFDQNPGPIYYRAWAWSAEKGWFTNPSGGWKESAIMTLLAFIAIAGVMSFLALRSSYFVLKFLAGLSWWGFAVYWLSNRPVAITAGSATDTIILLLLFFFGIAIMLMPFWYTKTEEGQEIGRGFKLPFMKTPEEEEKANYHEGRGERNDAYRNRVYGALGGRRPARRR